MHARVLRRAQKWVLDNAERIIDTIVSETGKAHEDARVAEVTYAAPHHLVADKPVLGVRRTRAGDAWERRTTEPAPPKGVGLGMPSVGVPAALPDAPTCG